MKTQGKRSFKAPDYSYRNWYRDPEVAGLYDKERFKSFSGRMFNQLEKWALLRTLHGLIGNSLIFEGACGTGRMTEPVLQNGSTLIACDISHEMINVARQKLQNKHGELIFIQADLENCPFRTETFDVAVVCRLLFHLDYLTQFRILAELKRISKSRIVINHAAGSYWYRWRRRLKRWLGGGIPVGYPIHDTWEEELFRRVGLKVVKRHWVARWFSEDVILLLSKDL